MAATEIEICSNALLMLGANPIDSFDGESDRVTLVANLWPGARDAVLRSHPWNCAVKRVSLAPDATAPAFEWSYAFTLPADCLRILSIGEVGENPEWQLEGRKILFEETELKLRYVYRNEDIPTWDALLVQAAEAYMAMTCAYPITKSAAQQEVMANLWKLKLREARGIDGLENPPETLGDFPLLNARY